MFSDSNDTTELEEEAVNFNGTECDYEAQIRTYMYCIGTPLALVGCICNLFLTHVFLKERQKISLYLTVLAFLDFMLCFIYIEAFAFQRITQLLQLRSLYEFIMRSAPVWMVVSRVVQLSIPYVLIASSAEKLAWITGQADINSRSNKMRILICFIIFISSVLLRGPTYFAMQVHEGDCADFFYSFMLSGTKFAQRKFYTVFDMVVQFIHFFVSFVILCLLNYVIVSKLRQCHRRARRQSACASITFTLARKGTIRSPFDDEARREAKRLRAAIHTTFVVITAYLACNSLNFLLYLVENLHSDLLYKDSTRLEFSVYYVFAGDLGTILFVLSSTIRIFIYYKYNPEIRQGIQDSLTWRTKHVKGDQPMKTELETIVHHNGLDRECSDEQLLQ